MNRIIAELSSILISIQKRLVQKLWVAMEVIDLSKDATSRQTPNHLMHWRLLFVSSNIAISDQRKNVQEISTPHSVIKSFSTQSHLWSEARLSVTQYTGLEEITEE